MKARLLALLLPATVLGALLAAGGIAFKMDVIPLPVWRFLWPSLVAVLFLALALGALLTGMRNWVWPLGTGFVVQVVGILLLWGRTFRSPWQPLIYTLSAVGLVLLIMLVVWLVVTLRARWLEQKMVQGLGDEGVDQQTIAQIRQNMTDAMNLLKKAGRGRNAIYELPWFLVIGRPQAGKTVAIKNSGLGLPVRKDWVKGVGGTHTCDWFFTNDLIFLDTPGRWVTEGTGEEGQRSWVELLRLLRKYRGRRPLDGLVVVVPADDLLSLGEEDLQQQASNVREVIDLLHAELRFRFPVYLLVSKSDLVEGFVDFFKGLPAQRRHEALGWSHADPNQGEPRRLIPAGFRRVLRRLEAYRLEMLARIASRTQSRRLFFFTEEFRRLQRSLTSFADILFVEDPANEPPVFRGFYFTSGTQGEGSPLGQALSSLAHTLGVRVTQPQAGAGEEEPKRSYFLLELFRTLMVGDEGLVGRTAGHWWRRRRDTLFAAFLPAAAGSVLLLLSLISFLLNSGVYEDVRTEVPAIVQELREETADATGDHVIRALQETEKLQGYHEQLAGFTLLRGLGMRRPGPLKGEAFAVFRDSFNSAVLVPTLRRAEAFVTDPERTCTDRTDVFYSVIWLRQGNAAEWHDDLLGFNKLWDLASDSKADEARTMLLDQFAYLKDHSPRDESLLPGISLKRMAESVRDGCSTTGAGSALESYRKFQDECSDAISPVQLTDCYTQLGGILGLHKEDFRRLKDHLDWLGNGLERIQDAEPEADPALRAIRGISVAEPGANACLAEFTEKVIPEIRGYTEKDPDLVEECRAAYDGATGRQTSKDAVAFDILKRQNDARKKEEEDLETVLNDFGVRCARTLDSRFRIDTRLPMKVSDGYRRAACRHLDKVQPEPPREAAASRPRQAPRPSAPAPVRASGLKWFEQPRQPSRVYTDQAWQIRRQEWEAILDHSKELPAGQQEYEAGNLRGQIQTYGREYAQVWKRYLESLELKDRRMDVPAWLDGLADGQELMPLLQQASKAISARRLATDPPFDVFAQELEGIAQVEPFVESKMPAYLNLLRNLSKDLGRFETNPGFWSQYRQQVASRNESNSLVALRAWVDANGSAGLAEGSLRNMLLEPARVAEEYMQSTDLAKAHWQDISRLYGEASGRFPFSPDPDAEMIDPDSLVALLGGKSGAVPRYKDMAGQLSLSPAAARWIDEAAQLSSILFEKGSDTPRSIRVRLSFVSEVYEPESITKDFELQELHFYMGDDSEYSGPPDEMKMKPIDFALFGKDASQFSAFRIKLAERKGMLGRTFGSNFKDGEVKVVSQVEGVWAPLKLIEKGAGEGGAEQLTFTMEVPYKKKEPGKLTLTLKADGDDLPPLLRLLEGGMPPLPRSAVED